MRIFSDIAMLREELALPLDEVAKVLDFPATTDRNKAASLFVGISMNKELRSKYRDVLMKRAAPIFLKMLRLTQPNNHDPAYSALRLLSGQSYGERDYRSWENWYENESKKSVGESKE